MTTPISSIRVAGLGLVFALLTAASAPAQPPRLDIAGCEQMTGAAKAEVCVPVTLTTNGVRVASVGFALEYDPSVLRLRDGKANVRAGSALKEGQNLMPTVAEETSPARLSLMVTPPVRIPIAVIGDGELVRLCFTVEEGAKPGCSPVRFAPGSVEMGDDKGKNIAIGPATGGGVRVR